jgi:hypothetical protein
MSFKAINDSISFNSFILTLLIYSAYLRIVKSNLLSLTVLQKAIIIKKAIIEIWKL